MAAEQPGNEKPPRAQKINHTEKINALSGWGYIDVVSALNI